MRIGPAAWNRASPAPRSVRASPPKFAAVLGGTVQGDRIRDATPAPTRPTPSTTPTPSPVRTLLERALGAESRVDRLLAAAAAGRTFSPGELLVLQSTVFRYTQTVEVASRVADRLVGTIKQTMGTQV